MIQPDDWLPMMVETQEQRHSGRNCSLVCAGPLIAVLMSRRCPELCNQSDRMRVVAHPITAA
jgi:hypothetical protein